MDCKYFRWRRYIMVEKTEWKTDGFTKLFKRIRVEYFLKGLGSAVICTAAAFSSLYYFDAIDFKNTNKKSAVRRMGVGEGQSCTVRIVEDILESPPRYIAKMSCSFSAKSAVIHAFSPEGQTTTFSAPLTVLESNLPVTFSTKNLKFIVNYVTTNGDVNWCEADPKV